MTSRRVLWVDFAKVIGIALVVLGHMDNIGSVWAFIFSFHMPLFFFLSGYLERDETDFRTMLKKYARTLLLPYLLFYGIFYTYWIILFVAQNGFDAITLQNQVMKPFLGMLWGNRSKTDFSEMINTPLWFLLGMFIVKLLHWLYNSISKHRTIYYCLCIFANFFLLYGIIALRDRGVVLPLSIGSAVLAFPFFAAGTLCRKVKKFQHTEPKRVKTIIFSAIGSFAGFAWLALYVKHFRELNGGTLDVARVQTGNDILLTFLTAAAGVLATVLLSDLIYRRENKIITLVSENTIVILAFHMIFIQLEQLLLKSLHIPSSLLTGLILTVINLALCIPLILTIRKFWPVLLGKRKKHDKSIY